MSLTKGNLVAGVPEAWYRSVRLNSTVAGAGRAGTSINAPTFELLTNVINVSTLADELICEATARLVRSFERGPG